MNGFAIILNRALGAILLTVAFAVGASAGDDELNALFEKLRTPGLEGWEAVEQEIWKEWSRSGSDAMDLLLERGREAMSEGDMDAAIEHLTALTDHEPDFAEGWNARATAYFHVGLYGPSIADIERTLALNPRHFGAMSGLSMILVELGRPQDALTILRKAQQVHPHRPDINDGIERLERQVGGADL